VQLHLMELSIAPSLMSAIPVSYCRFLKTNPDGNDQSIANRRLSLAYDVIKLILRF
jgi:hypothetical protein